MRPIPLLTAILVMLALYGLVLQRDALLAFARGEPQDQQADPSFTADIPAQAAPQPDLIGVVVRRSTAREIDSAVILRGQTRALRQVEVRAETSAIVISDPLRKGAFVKRGDLLCKLDPGVREAALAEASAKLKEARSRVPESEAWLKEAHARLGEAQINYNAARKLKEGGYASDTRLAATEAAIRAAEANLATARTRLDTTRSGIEAAQAAVAAAEREIARLTITAPFDGLLESDAAELGSLMQPGSLCATVIQLDPVKLVGFVPETEVARVKVGAPAGAELATGQRVEGKVTFISRSADPLTRTFEVEISVPNPDLAIRDGQTAAIAVQAAGAMAHLLPQSALTLNNDGQLGVRVVSDDAIVGFLPVSLVRDTVDGIWVDGLPAEANVIVVGQDFVTAGVRVKPTWQETDQ
ncbi:efflux RND transporter periplasmic adaptor subunit [Pukyongiella litopenaei]|uniref:Efflux RND transporter periplasmic adaptor subunit n=1 Tax=Pukyongiella litopenaei TaxID=2605946 RepID=A0A2S0MKG2_9RHOB|nr:efflux RND transporter periplasmic adaptor subunit [Pukyongiella litopenaei]AVO36378.1 efflux RND transporter periplasmic adaptor subunit [Pukyongiella litopenaei]